MQSMCLLYPYYMQTICLLYPYYMLIVSDMFAGDRHQGGGWHRCRPRPRMSSTSERGQSAAEYQRERHRCCAAACASTRARAQNPTRLPHELAIRAAQGGHHKREVHLWNRGTGHDHHCFIIPITMVSTYKVASPSSFSLFTSFSSKFGRPTFAL